MRLELHAQLGVGGSSSAELLLDLRRVAVRGDLVGEDVLARHREVRGLVERAPGAGDALLGVDHDVGDQPRARERREREQRGGRVAAGVGDDRRGGDLLAVQLGQPVDGLARAARGAGARRTSARRSRARRRKSALRSTTRTPRSRSAADGRAPRRRAGRRRPRRRLRSRRVEVELLDHQRHAVARVELVEARGRPPSAR